MVFIFPAPFRPNLATDINPYFMDQEKVKIKNSLLMLAPERLENVALTLKQRYWSATVLGSILASSEPVKSERRQMKQCWIKYWKGI
jgi:hypothetical protein